MCRLQNLRCDQRGPSRVQPTIAAKATIAIVFRVRPILQRTLFHWSDQVETSSVVGIALRYSAKRPRDDGAPHRLHMACEKVNIVQADLGSTLAVLWRQSSVASRRGRIGWHSCPMQRRSEIRPALNLAFRKLMRPSCVNAANHACARRVGMTQSNMSTPRQIPSTRSSGSPTPIR